MKILNNICDDNKRKDDKKMSRVRLNITEKTYEKLKEYHDGEVLCTYPMLCAAFGEPKKYGDSMKADLKAMNYFCNLETVIPEGHKNKKYLVKDIYFAPQDNLDVPLNAGQTINIFINNLNVNKGGI